jgi:metal-sulfur cluster biosynthetic enzyme
VTDGTAEVADLVGQALDEVLDPCSIARGVPAGMRDMGLVNGIDVRPRADGRVDVVLDLRLTSPACSFALYFDQQVELRLLEIPSVAAVEIRWDDRFEWSDDDLSPRVQEQLADKRRRLLASLPIR